MGPLIFYWNFFIKLSVRLKTYKVLFNTVFCGFEKAQSLSLTELLRIFLQSEEISVDTYKEISQLLANLKGSGDKNVREQRGKVIKFNNSEWNVLFSCIR